MMNSSHSGPCRVLTYGHDRALLETRRMLLSEAGYAAEAVISGEDFEEKTGLASSSTFELIVLCHTVPEAERASIVARLSSITAIYPMEKSVTPAEFLRNVATSLRAKVPNDLN